MVKNPPANAEDIETLVQSLRQEDPLEESMPTHSCSCLENAMDGGARWVSYSPWGHKELGPTDHTYTYIYIYSHIHIVVYIDTYIYVLCMYIYIKV